MIDFIKATTMNDQTIFINGMKIVWVSYGTNLDGKDCCVLQLEGEEGNLFVNKKFMDNWISISKGEQK
jgi:hypothetical protein